MANKEIRLKINVEGNAEESLKNIQKSYDDIAKAAETAKKATQGVGGPSASNPTPTTGADMNLQPGGKYLKKSFRNDKEEMIGLAVAGDKTSESFRTAQQKAGRFKDEMDEVNNRIKYFSQSGGEKAAQGLSESINLVGASAQVAVGSMTLLGMSNEEATKTVAKLASIEAVMNGVKQVTLALQSDSMFMLGLENAKMKALALTQGAYTAVVGTSTGALKAFRLALAGTGIGLAVIAIGALVNAFMDASDASDKLTASQQLNAEKAKKAAEDRKKESDAAVIGIENQIKAQQKLRVQILRNQGKDNEADALEQSFLTQDKDKLNKKQALEKKEVRRLEKQLKDNADMIATYKNAADKYKKSGDTDQADKFKKDADDLKKKNNSIQVELNENMNKLNFTNRQIETAYYEGVEKRTGGKNKSQNTISKPQTLSAVAPKTFNVYINSLGEIQEVNIMSDKDEKEFQQTLVNTLMGALTTVQAQTSR